MKVSHILSSLALMATLGCGAAKKTPQPEKAVISAPSEQVIKHHLPLMDQGHSTRFSQLPLEGSVEAGERLWSGDYWALNKEMINQRWYTPGGSRLELASPSKEEAFLLSEEDLKLLSPSEKFDLLVGRYDYPLKTEVAKKSNVLALYWEGIGNGWACASSNHPEPTPKALPNPDGLMVPFGSSDIKALLSYYYAYGSQLPPTQHLGIRCTMTQEHSAEFNECNNDLNAASFHVALANSLGIRKESFLADMDRFKEVWNHPIVAFKSEVLEEAQPLAGAPEGAKRALKIKTKVSYVDLVHENAWGPIKNTNWQVISNRIYKYDLYLNEEGEIIGGDWRSNDRPDFIWSMPAINSFEAPFDRLTQLLE